ncbi:hypothetical protein [Vibrio aerogenes]|uniref:hypothetical protein n=1 Tax=Vibrio aerogenes TaxID=92172 RepID=UPI000937B4CE|nr:hypothetical protein [Vibrio aerogenes]
MTTFSLCGSPAKSGFSEKEGGDHLRPSHLCFPDSRLALLLSLVTTTPSSSQTLTMMTTTMIRFEGHFILKSVSPPVSMTTASAFSMTFAHPV